MKYNFPISNDPNFQYKHLMTHISNKQAWKTHEGLDHSGNDEPNLDFVDGELLDKVLQTGNPDFLRRVCARRSTRVFL